MKMFKSLSIGMERTDSRRADLKVFVLVLLILSADAHDITDVWLGMSWRLSHPCSTWKGLLGLYVCCGTFL
jgi:hypothetical protein